MTKPSGVVAAIFVTALAGFAGGLISLSHDLSRERIAANQRQRLVTGLEQVLGDIAYDNDLETSRKTFAPPGAPGTMEPIEVFVATMRGIPVAVVLTAVAPDGYSGPIALLVGVSAAGVLTGVRVTAHRETPGLGDAIETTKSPWILQFTGKSLGNPPPTDWRVTKDGGQFDAITGATVTPRAITQAIRNTLVYFRDHRTEILAPTPTDRAPIDE